MLPTGTVTFLFTDIEGSTRLWQTHRAVMPRVIERHDELLRSAVETHGGVVFKTVGDAICAAFGSVTDAAEAAVAGQRALRDEEWEGGIEVRVRMALHTGTSDARDGDYFGPTLNRVARLLSTGHGGQILLSLSTAEMVRDHLSDGVTLSDLGEHQLRDLDHPEHVYGMFAPDLPSSFPALKSETRHAGHLPQPATPLVGRMKEIAEICDMLRRDSVKLVTLTGPGGTGKTRLSIEVGRHVRDDFADGIFFVPLAPVGGPELVPSAIAAVVGIQDTSNNAPHEALKVYCRDKSILLILDNFEHVVESAPYVGDLLESCPSLTVLVTSRTVLRLAAEHDYAVTQLPAPCLDGRPDPEQLMQYDAVVLFVDRAQAARADFSLTEDNAPAIAAICCRLDGLPLALELAAMRVRLFPPQALLERLDQSLKLLTGGARDLPDRQQTLRATLDWSYSLLTDGERVLLGRLSVFAGGLSLDSAEAICNLPQGLRIEVLDGISSLVEQSLVQQESAGDEFRFTLLQAVREYGREKLVAAGEEAALQNVYARWFLNLAREAVDGMEGPNQLSWLAVVEREYPNIRQATAIAIEHRWTDIALSLASVTGAFVWRLRQYWNETRIWLEQALALPGADRRTTARAMALLTDGRLTREPARAQLLLEECVDIARQLHLDKLVCNASLSLAWAYASQGNLSRGRSLLEQSLELAREIGYAWITAILLHGLGSMAIIEANLPAARPLLLESLHMLQRIGTLLDTCLPLNSLGDLARLEGEYEEAAGYYEQSLHVIESQKITGLRGNLHHNLGYVSLHLDRVRGAQEHFTLGLETFRQQGDTRGIAECVAGFAAVALARRQPQLAAGLLAAAQRILSDLGTGMYGTNQLEYEQNLAAAKAALEPTTFEQAWEDGQSLTLEGAIARVAEISAE